MRYHYRRGVIVPFARKYFGVIALAAVAIFAFSQMVMLIGSARAEASCLETVFENNDRQSSTTCVVEVTCDAISITADRNLSNIIVLYQDGTYSKYNESDFGSTESWEVPQDDSHGPIVGIWIHTGSNHYSPDELMAIFPPEALGGANSVGRYHQVEAANCEETVPEDTEEQPPVLGAITGLIYHDQNNDGTQDGSEPPLQNWTAWLLAHDSPFVLVGEDTTGPDGTFSFTDLPLGTYYVCQALQSGWLQTELAAIGTGLGDGATIPIGTNLGDSEELQALIDQFCYQVTLTEEDPASDVSVFGNFFPQNQEDPGTGGDSTPGQVLGDSTEKPNEPKEGGRGGQVLAASTSGQVLAATGQPTYWPTLVGIFLLLSSIATIRLARK